MAHPRVAPYGSWKSPITSELIVSESIGLSQIALNGKELYWLESYPGQDGRVAVVRLRPDGSIEEVTRLPFIPRSRVHEYGGASYAVDGGMLYFTNLTDQRIYRMALRADAGVAARRGGAQGEEVQPAPITPEGALRYADFAVDERRGLLFCVREDHRGLKDPSGEETAVGAGGRAGKPGEAANTIVKVCLAGDKLGGEVIVSGNDFYASPRLSPDGSRLAWITWSHPNMPWDGCELWIGELDESGSVVGSRLVAGGAEESIFQPEWSPGGALYFVSDRSGWWNLYRFAASSGSAGSEIEPVVVMEVELGRPQWLLGDSTYAFESEGRIACTYLRGGVSHLALVDTESLALREIDCPYTSIGELRASPGQVLFFAASPSAEEALVRLDLDARRFEQLRRSSSLDLDPGIASLPEEIHFAGSGGEESYAFFYPPRNDEFRPPEGELPPLVVMSHGGPTSAASPVLQLGIVYWTSRGFAVLDVNYGGSSGYGRAFRRRIEGKWGIVDVEDCIAGVRYLIARGSVDPQRVAVRGGSAGGYTTLCALTFHDLFRAGASYYGISDLESLARDTHKFESRYLERLVGPYPGRADLYRARSPIHFVDRLSCPLILFQGSEDRVVPPAQSRMMYEAVREKGLPVAYIEFEREQHGFRRAESLAASIDAELYFYSRLFGFTPAGDLPSIPIENLPPATPRYPDRRESG